jgi:hypothetical protein
MLPVGASGAAEPSWPVTDPRLWRFAALPAPWRSGGPTWVGSSGCSSCTWRPPSSTPAWSRRSRSSRATGSGRRRGGPAGRPASARSTCDPGWVRLGCQPWFVWAATIPRPPGRPTPRSPPPACRPPGGLRALRPLPVRGGARPLHRRGGRLPRLGRRLGGWAKPRPRIGYRQTPGVGGHGDPPHQHPGVQHGMAAGRGHWAADQQVGQAQQRRPGWAAGSPGYRGTPDNPGGGSR